MFGTYVPVACAASDPPVPAPSLHCPAFKLEVSAHAPEVMRLTYVPVGAFSPQGSFAVVSNGTVPLTWTRTCDGWAACTSALSVVVRETDCAVRVLRADGTVLLEDASGPHFPAPGLSRRLDAQERVYGFGERTGPLDRRGRTLDGRNTDAYDANLGGFRPDGDPLYLPLPFYISLKASAAHGVFTDNTFHTRFAVGTDDARALVLSASDGPLDQYIIDGPTFSQVLERYTELTGRAPLPAQWALGYHQSRWGYSPASQVLDIATQLRQRQLPADAMWLDIQHMRGFRSFTFDPETFADPPGLTGALAAQGFHTVAIVDPGIKIDPGWDLYDQGVMQHLFLSAPGAGPFVGQVWPGDAVFPDFSSQATRAWWQGLVPRLTSQGVSGIWLDMNEPTSFEALGVPDTLVADSDGQPSTLAQIHNVYALDEARATFAGLEAARPGQRPFILSRSGFAGIQRYAAVWTGDAVSGWATLAETPAMIAGLGLSGVPWAGSDVGGYSGGATPELFARWMQVGSISPFFRGHVTQNVPGQEPWAFGEEVEDISRDVMTARSELLPYWYSLADESARTGAPPLRPLVYEFQDDPLAPDVSDEVMVGPFLLYAPVLSSGATTRRVYLPGGRWFELSSDKAYAAGSAEVGLTLAALPAFVREGAIVPRRPAQQFAGEKPFDTLSLDLYPSDAATQLTFYDDAGDGAAAFARTSFRLEPTATGVRLTASARDGSYGGPARSLQLRFHRIDQAPTAVSVSGIADPVYTWDANGRLLQITLPDAAPLTVEVTYPRALLDDATTRRTFRVQVPASTPSNVPIFIATSANGWQQAQMANVSPGVAELALDVPRGEWVFYKFTRGDWNSVEVWPGCAEATNRYAFGQAEPVKDNIVFAWRDLCP
nr:oligosaccharide 4-alpha-D-glucosyltransferase [uncultured bacterium]